MKRNKIACSVCNDLISLSNVQRHRVKCLRSLIPKIKKPNLRNTGKPGKNQFTKAKELGLPPPQVSTETRAKLAAHSKNIVWDEQRRKKHSEAMKQAVKQNPESYTSSNRGRTRQIEYDGIKFQGQWELDFYKWAKDQRLDPKRPDRSFKYSWNGDRWYHPDFYIAKLDVYVEVKGYQTDRDQAKWSQFPERLVVIKEQQIKEIRNGSFKGIDL